MSNVPVRELRNNTADVIRRVQSAGNVTITSNGVPVAILSAVRAGHRSAMPRHEFVQVLHGKQADAGLRRDLEEFAGETTDDLEQMR